MAKSTWLAAIGGGICGAALTALLFVSVGPQLVGEDEVRAALVENPDILLEASAALRDSQTAPVIEANRELIETPFGTSVQGSGGAEVTMVEFFDYACGYCKQAKEDLDRLLEEQDSLRIVYRELPVLGPQSVVAARASLAASKVGKFAPFHDKLYELGQPTDENIDAALAHVGLDRSALDDESFNAELEKNYELANSLGATGTPLFVVGDRIIPEAAGYDAYVEAVEAARAKTSG